MLSKIKSQIRKFKYKIKFNSKFQHQIHDGKFYHVNSLRSEGFSIDKLFLAKSNIAQRILGQYQKITEEEINQIIFSNSNKESVRDGANANVKAFKRKLHIILMKMIFMSLQIKMYYYLKQSNTLGLLLS